MDIEKRDLIFKNYNNAKKKKKKLNEEESDIIERYQYSEGEKERYKIKKQYSIWQNKYDKALNDYDKSRKEFLSFTGLDTLE